MDADTMSMTSLVQGLVLAQVYFYQNFFGKVANPCSCSSRAQDFPKYLSFRLKSNEWPPKWPYPLLPNLDDSKCSFPKSYGEFLKGELPMALRRMLGFSDGDLMRSDSKPCSRLMRQTAGIFTVGGGLGFWVLCRLHYGPRITVPRSLRWAACGAISTSTTTALLVRLFSPECEPQNIAAYDRKK